MVCNDSIVYKIKQAQAEQIYKHLKECDEQFLLQLSQRTDVQKYSEKIFEKAFTLEAWADNSLVGLVAVYFNDLNNSAFITNISVSKNFLKAGIGTELINRCIKYSRKKGMSEIILEVNSENKKAIAFYKKFCFTEYKLSDNLFLMKFIL